MLTSCGFWTIPLLTLLKMNPKGKRNLLALDLKKALGRICFENIVPKESFFDSITRCLYSLRSTLYIYWREISLEEIIEIWVISYKDINPLCWSLTSAWVFSYGFGGIFRGTFSWEHLWRAASPYEIPFFNYIYFSLHSFNTFYVHP